MKLFPPTLAIVGAILIANVENLWAAHLILAPTLYSLGLTWWNDHTVESTATPQDAPGEPIKSRFIYGDDPNA